MPAQGTSRDNLHRYAPMLFGVLVGICATILVLLVWRNERAAAHRERMTELNAEADLVESLVRQRIDALELIMRGGASLIAGDTLPTEDQWQSYVAGLYLPSRYPAVVGLGYAPYIERADLARFQQDWKSRTGDLINIRPWGIRPEYAPVIYLAPATRGTQQIIGRDMYVESNRREAMQRAMEVGQPWLSSPIRLFLDEDGGNSTSYIFYTPVYHGGLQPATIAARRVAMAGWVYAPFRTQRFIEMALQSMKREMKLRVSDATDPRHVATVMEDPGLSGKISQGPIERTMTVHGRILRLEFFGGENVGAQRSLWVLWAGLPLALAAGLIAFLLARTQTRAQALARDMTRAHARSETLFRSAMMYSAIGKAILDHDGRIIEVNPAFTQLFERGIESLRGSHFVDLLEHSSIGLVEQGVEGGVRREIRRFARDNGDLRHVALVYGNVPPTDGVDVSLMVQAEDISERFRSEARIRALNRTLELRVDARTRELSEVNRQLESFAYSVSHDLRAPLRAIDGFSRLLSERHAATLDENAQGYLTRIRDGAHRMDELIGAILSISRVSRGELQREPLDLSALAHEVVEELRIAEPQRAVEVEIAPNLHADGDPLLVRTLMQNLIGNAWKFTRDRDPAHIRFGRDGAGHYFVEDDGVGFDLAHVGKLFQPFQRLHTESEFPGHGIGLATVKRIIERHGGMLQAHGNVGRGARFVFTLPVVPGEGEGEHHE